MSVRNVLVVGGGFTGLTAAIALAQRGVDVTVVDKVRAWARVGHGLTIQGNALRVFRELGVLEEILGDAFPEEDGITLFLADGTELAHLDTPRTGGPDLPPTIGALRPDVHGALVRKAEAEGVAFRLGTELVSFETVGATASATLSDGTTSEWDLVIVAEGIHSRSRAALGITEQVASSGLGIWRAVTSRKPDMRGGIAFPLGSGGAYKVGYTPVSETHCYVFVLCEPQRTANDLADWQEVRRLMAGFHGEFDFLRESIHEDTFLNFQEIEWIFVAGPWHRGRVLALGEAVHAIPPLVAQGAALCVEDALLLARHVTAEGDLEEQLAAFHARRVPRIKGVVDATLLLAEWEQRPGTPDADPGRVMDEALQALIPAP
ncbi:FAD-dependent oxidoreductase [Flexivirga oryzae]|uniref:2-polyprenyl-6-methoxyphenol hydroxylase-like FAD-dependent oxidoreductase n=1 Tax=Flexivirga oryzae TaxID=1794944 RepID=A0A839NAX2_9MICO|nr:FAD-dependent oxidoreductase [Flexivirga oryzae]MBB2891871.1 2-polyprenyl-6-methoxyphenol hydroxylase-like FAD-dependent oxidoreductase [Flexivirga oryzae]